mmetsp:Transcript_62179/g.167682  ORF Transcript_62179/g.167682 Transcript_62179/m.167682 type:complete len:228 (-) Transcript_62179:748-1431(-)
MAVVVPYNEDLYLRTYNESHFRELHLGTRFALSEEELACTAVRSVADGADDAIDLLRYGVLCIVEPGDLSLQVLYPPEHVRVLLRDGVREAPGAHGLLPDEFRGGVCRRVEDVVGVAATAQHVDDQSPHLVIVEVHEGPLPLRIRPDVAQVPGELPDGPRERQLRPRKAEGCVHLGKSRGDLDEIANTEGNYLEVRQCPPHGLVPQRLVAEQHVLAPEAARSIHAGP